MCLHVCLCLCMCLCVGVRAFLCVFVSCVCACTCVVWVCTRVRCAGASVCLRVCGGVHVSACLCVGVRGCVRVSPVHVGARVCASTCCVCVCLGVCACWCGCACAHACVRVVCVYSGVCACGCGCACVCTRVMLRKSFNANTFPLGTVRFYSIHGGRRTHIESSWIQQCRISNVPTDTQ